MPAIKTVFGVVDELTTPEILNLGTGIIVDTICHIVGENFFDNYFKDKYPQNYFVYSTGVTSAAMGIVATILFLVSRKPEFTWVQYIVGGIILGELVQLLDLIRVTLGVRG